ncbi:DUF928 domain-containing protein [Leptolyngbya ohadii]|uniref:DUF928 domain-containing protein n=1 Tax=Leptolyngbya ohadii TaxID=1962290 RepID=UPI000B59ADD6|nr:DUF928 domain-containing protein [Leptolyngbya ohadii]
MPSQFLDFLIENRTVPFTLRFLRLTLTTFWLTLTILSSPALALPQFVPPPPPYRGEPGNRPQGGGTRSPECDRYTNLTPLVPSVPVGNGSMLWGLTTMARPTLWITAPVGLTAGTLIKLTLRGSNDRTVYESTQTTIATLPGSFSLSPTTPALQEGETYRWTVSIFCDPEVPDVPIQIKGSIQRVAVPASLREALNTDDPLQHSEAYAQAGIWYDTLTVLGSQYQQTAGREIADAWLSLLQQVGLERSSHLPIGSCCR